MLSVNNASTKGLDSDDLAGESHSAGELSLGNSFLIRFDQPLYYGMCISLLHNTLSFCVVTGDSEGELSVDYELTWRSEKGAGINEQSLLKLIEDIEKITNKQLTAIERYGIKGYQFPVVVASHEDLSVLDAVLKASKLNQECKDILYHDYPVTEAIQLALVGGAIAEGYAREDINLYSGTFCAGARRNIRASDSKKEYRRRGKIERYGQALEDGDASTLKRLCRMARLFVRTHLKKDAKLGEKSVYKRRSNAYFLQFVGEEERFFEHPDVKDAIQKEFRRQGYSGEVVLSFPTSEPNPYFSSLLKPIMKELRKSSKINLVE